MNNPRHSSERNDWMTPPDLVERCREVLGEIDLDPASSEEANKVIMAKEIYTKDDNGLDYLWEGSVFVNPPSGRLGNKSLPLVFWNHLMWSSYTSGGTRHGIFIAFSLEQLQTSQNADYGYAMTDYPLCIPRKRVKYLLPGGKKSSPTHASAIIYVPGKIDESAKFRDVFIDYGAVLNADP